MNEKNLKEITDDVIQILLKKNVDYGGASFDLGLNGNMVHLWDKIKRYRTLVENQNKGLEPNFESVQDTLKDIMGYAIIGLLILDDDKYIIGLVAKFTKLLSENGFLSMIRMTPDDIYFRSLSVDALEYGEKTENHGK